MEERGRKSPILIAVIFLAIIGAVFAYMTMQGKTVTPIPEEGVRIIFASPHPTEVPPPTASPSATPKVVPTIRPKATPTPKPKDENQISPTVKPTTAVTPKPTPTPAS